jgi:flagellar protein FliS
MLFDGAIRALERAGTGFEDPDPVQCVKIVHNSVQRAQEIIRELNYCLDMEKGGEFATNMRRLYHYFERRLTESNVRKDREGVDEVMRHLTVLRDAWATMLQNQSVPQGRESHLLELALA